MSYDIGLLLDGLILVFLSVTIFYAARLSLFLKSFREGKEGMQLLIRDLNVTVDKAEESIKIMKGYSMETEEEIREIINEAKYLSDELRFMNESGNGLADRLEKLANRNRELVDLIESSGGIGTQKPLQEEEKKKDPWAVADSAKRAMKNKLKSERKVETYSDDFEISDFDIDEDDEYDFQALDDGAYREEEVHHSRVNTNSKSKLRSFAIFDRDAMEGQENTIQDDLAMDDYDDDVIIEERQFHSKAEQDLYEALQRRKNSKINEVS
jgi:hypothetical protein